MNLSWCARLAVGWRRPLHSARDKSVSIPQWPELQVGGARHVMLFSAAPGIYSIGGFPVYILLQGRWDLQAAHLSTQIIIIKVQASNRLHSRAGTSWLQPAPSPDSSDNTWDNYTNTFEKNHKQTNRNSMESIYFHFFHSSTQHREDLKCRICVTRKFQHQYSPKNPFSKSSRGKKKKKKRKLTVKWLA